MTSTLISAKPSRPRAAREFSADQLPVGKTPTHQQIMHQLYEAFSPRRWSWKNLDWIVTGWIVLMHIGCLLAPFYFTWSALGVCLLLHWMTGSIGVCLGYHRYLSHKSLKLAWPARFFTLLCGSLSGEGSPMCWAATHRLHHQRSDQEGDPHSPLDGALWAHIWWLMLKRTPHERAVLYRRFIPDLVHDRMLRFFERTYFHWQVISAVALYALGGLPMLLWGLCARVVFMYHSTWFVNSATHLWGYRNYETRDESRNLWWVALLAYGEGWHNNHHAHPHSARAGHRWWEFDPTFWVIRLLQWTGLAWDVDDRNPLHDTSCQKEPTTQLEPNASAAAEIVTV